jgi:hypothetical protein
MLRRGLDCPLLMVPVTSLFACGVDQDDLDRDVTSMPADEHHLQCTPAPHGMIGWWPADGNSGDIARENDGGVSGGVIFASGMVDQAFILNGTDGYVDLHDEASARGLTAFTLDAWVNVSAPSLNTQYIYSELGEFLSGARVQFYVQGGSGRLVLDVKPYDDAYPGQDRVSAISDEIVTPNKWVHVAGIWRIESGIITTTVLVDGQPTSESSNATIGAPISDTPPGAGVNYIGGSRDGLGGSLGLLGMFNGGIDEVEFFDRALTISEIEAIFKAGSAGKCKLKFRLPWTAGETWYLTSGPHGENRSALDFAPRNFNPRTGKAFRNPCSRLLGDDHWVRAAAGGSLSAVLPRGCPLVQIKHDDGTTTNYFHLRSSSVRQLGLAKGAMVQAGQILGHPSCEIGPRHCHATQATTGVHVHFYRTDPATDTRLSADSLEISGWTVHAVGGSREGTMTKDMEIRSTQGSAVGLQCPPDGAPPACAGQRNDLVSDNIGNP